eukprot:35269-Eustigmatos_ZCMA.PRE.1
MVGIVNWGMVGKIELDETKLRERCERLNKREGTYWFLIPVQGITREALIEHLTQIQPYLQWKYRPIRGCLVPIIRWHELVDVSLKMPPISPEYRPGIHAPASSEQLDLSSLTQQQIKVKKEATEEQLKKRDDKRMARLELKSKKAQLKEAIEKF